MKMRKRSLGVLFLLFFFTLNFVLFPSWADASDQQQPWQGPNTPNQDANNTNSPEKNDNNDTPGCPTGGEPIELPTGNHNYTHQDISIPGRGPELSLSRTYNNRSLYCGPFGYGWSHNYNLRLSVVAELSLSQAVVVRTDKVLIQYGTGYKEFFTKNANGSFTAQTGCFATLTRNVDGSFTYREKNGTAYLFSQDGLLTRIADRNNNALTLQYDGAKRLTYVIDPSERKLYFHYNQSSWIDHITIMVPAFTFDSTTYHYEYDQEGNLIKSTDPLGNATSYTYDAKHNLLTITDPKENKKPTPIPYVVNTYDGEDRVVTQRFGSGSFSYQYYPAEKKTVEINRKGYKRTVYYNESRKPITEVDHQGNTVIKEWDSQENLKSITDARGNITRFEYDTKGNITKVIYPITDPATSLPVTQQMLYEPTYSRITKIIDPYKKETRFAYDARGNLTSIIDPQGKQSSLDYDSFGQLTSITDANLNQMLFAYDTYGNPSQITRVIPDGPDYVTELEYSPFGFIDKITDARGNDTQFVHDVMGNLNRMIDTLNNPTDYTLDANGNIIRIAFQDSVGNSLSAIAYEYDILDQLVKITDDLNNVTRYEYDKNGNRTKLIDANGNTTMYTYDSLDRLVSETDAEGHITQYAYDENGNLKTLTDAKYKTTFFAYDALDRLTQIKYPDMSTEKSTYDHYGNISSYTNRANETISYEYDSLGRRIKKLYPDGKSITYGYDPGGRLTSIKDTHGEILYAYDAADRVTSVTYPGGKQVSYAYDAVGNRTRLVYPGQVETISYVYDALNRLKEIKDNSNKVLAGYTYDVLSRRTRVDLGNGTHTMYEYDQISQLTRLANKLTSPEQIISSFQYTYDKVGNRKSMTTLAGTYSYSYDKIYQLTRVVNPASQQTDYQFDPLGNRTTVNEPGGLISYVTNWLNQYTQVGGQALSYDQRGNLTSDGENSYTYTCENRLIQSATPGGAVTYDYDALGRRIEKAGPSGGNESIHYLYDGPQVIMQFDGSGSETARYIYGPGIDEPVVMRTGGATYYYQFDGLGSVTGLTNASGGIVESYSYDVYGKPLIRNAGGHVLAASSIGNSYMFTGREYDKETGLYYYRARYYSTELGRFLQPDPIGFGGEDMNLYRYVRNDPVGWIDPWGLWQWSIYKGIPVIYKDIWGAGGGGGYRGGKIYIGSEVQRLPLSVQESVLFHEYIHSQQNWFKRNFLRTSADIEAYQKQREFMLKKECEARDKMSKAKPRSKEWMDSVIDVNALENYRKDIVEEYLKGIEDKRRQRIDNLYRSDYVRTFNRNQSYYYY